MTPTQVEYWKLQETKRSNLANESQKRGELAETSRANRARESQNYLSYQEDVRHNVQTENLDLSKLGETERHNMSVEAEAERHNLETEEQALDKLKHDKRMKELGHLHQIKYDDAMIAQGWSKTFGSNIGNFAKLIPLLP